MSGKSRNRLYLRALCAAKGAQQEEGTLQHFQAPDHGEEFAKSESADRIAEQRHGDEGRTADGEACADGCRGKEAPKEVLDTSK